MAGTIDGGQTRGELWQILRRVSDRRRKDCNLRSWALADRETQVSGHRGLSSGVASGKSCRSRYAYGWVEMSTPLSSCIHC
jgi:hypothetical protein